MHLNIDDIVNNRNLTTKMKGLYITALGIYKDNPFTFNEINELFSDGVMSIRTTLNDLLDMGFIEYTQVKDKGRYVGSFYWLSDGQNITRDKNTEMFVYLMYNTNASLYKIGITQKPNRRLGAIKSSSGMDIELLVYKQHENAEEIEAYMHDKLNKHRTIGEWFDLGNNPESVVDLFETMFSEYMASKG